MRRIICLVLILLALGCLAAVVPVVPSATDPPLSGWRRTTDGWVRPNWTSAAAARSRPLHPALVGLFQALAAVSALVAFPPVRTPHRDG